MLGKLHSRFCEWQERLRQVFKPGLAESKDAEAFEAVWSALNEQYNKQKETREVHPKAASLTLDMGQEQPLEAHSLYRRAELKILLPEVRAVHLASTQDHA